MLTLTLLTNSIVIVDDVVVDGIDDSGNYYWRWLMYCDWPQFVIIGW